MNGNSTSAEFRTRRGSTHALPLFLPVYQPRERAFQLAMKDDDIRIDGLIVNAFFLYKQRELRRQLTEETDIKAYVGFDGLIATDSGAFQGFTRKLYLSNRDIVRFQDQIGSDVIAPLDLVTPPGDTRTIAESKLEATQKRIREALTIAEHGMVAGVQQGGRFHDLRRRSTEGLLEMGISYLAIGSLVPFFNRNHDMGFAGQVVREARSAAGPDLPMHIYGAGDPLELPFFTALGATIFDSASYGHYANMGAYMTPYGALTDPGPVVAGEYVCRCSACRESDDAASIFKDAPRLNRHNLWTICKTVMHLRELVPSGGLPAYLDDVLERHMAWFPGSALGASWQKLNDTPA
jgi:7-cyano-7-deazaguanine tRNA-ribosyltransferase